MVGETDYSLETPRNMPSRLRKARPATFADESYGLPILTSDAAFYYPIGTLYQLQPCFIHNRRNRSRRPALEGGRKLYRQLSCLSFPSVC